jgi:hypothetical protein
MISAKPVGVGAVSQQWIPTGEQSGLQTHRNNGKRFVVRADEKLTAFVELESTIRPLSNSRCFCDDPFQLDPLPP